VRSLLDFGLCPCSVFFAFRFSLAFLFFIDRLWAFFFFTIVYLVLLPSFFASCFCFCILRFWGVFLLYVSCLTFSPLFFLMLFLCFALLYFSFFFVFFVLFFFLVALVAAKREHHAIEAGQGPERARS